MVMFRVNCLDESGLTRGSTSFYISQLGDRLSPTTPYVTPPILNIIVFIDDTEESMHAKVCKYAVPVFEKK